MRNEIKEVKIFRSFWYAVVVATPGNDAPCVFPYWMKMLCELNEFINDEKNKKRLRWENDQDSVCVYFKNKECAESFSLIDHVNLWESAAKMSREFNANTLAKLS